jgi:hypothetical protein
MKTGSTKERHRDRENRGGGGKTEKGRGGGKVDKKKKAAIIRCCGTLHVTYRRNRNHSFVFGTKLHKCMVGQGGSGELDIGF